MSLKKEMWRNMEGSWIIHCLGMFSAQWDSGESVARDRIVPIDLTPVRRLLGDERAGANR